jgi:hypothetical protein
MHFWCIAEEFPMKKKQLNEMKLLLTAEQREKKYWN